MDSRLRRLRPRSWGIWAFRISFAILCGSGADGGEDVAEAQLATVSTGLSAAH